MWFISFQVHHIVLYRKNILLILQSQTKKVAGAHQDWNKGFTYWHFNIQMSNHSTRKLKLASLNSAGISSFIFPWPCPSLIFKNIRQCLYKRLRRLSYLKRDRLAMNVYCITPVLWLCPWHLPCAYLHVCMCMKIKWWLGSSEITLHAI